MLNAFCMLGAPWNELLSIVQFSFFFCQAANGGFVDNFALMPSVLAVAAIVAVASLIIASAIHAAKQTQARRDALAALASEIGFRFNPDKDTRHDDEYAHFEVFRRGHSRAAYNTLTGAIDPGGDEGLAAMPIKMGDFTYKITSSNGKTTTTRTYNFSYLILHLPYGAVPDLLIRAEGVFDKLAGAFGFDDIDFESEEFSRRFHVKSADKKFAYDVCHPRMMEFLMQSDPPTIDIERGRCCLVNGSKRWEPADFKAMLGWAKAFFEQWPEHVVKQLS